MFAGLFTKAVKVTLSSISVWVSHHAETARVLGDGAGLHRVKISKGMTRLWRVSEQTSEVLSCVCVCVRERERERGDR